MARPRALAKKLDPLALSSSVAPDQYPVLHVAASQLPPKVIHSPVRFISHRQRAFLGSAGSTVQGLFKHQVHGVPLGHFNPFRPSLNCLNENNAQKAIGNCQASYKKVKESKDRITNMKEPGKNAPELDTILYGNKKVSKKAFVTNFAQFKKFFELESKKIAKATTAEALQNLVMEYSSNCSRFSQGLLNFVDWATTGAGNKLYGRIYNQWLNEANCGKPQCP